MRGSSPTPKRSTKDINQIAARIVEESTGISVAGKNPSAVALGRLGGPKGGKERPKRLTAQRRREIDAKAANFRWGSKAG